MYIDPLMCVPDLGEIISFIDDFIKWHFIALDMLWEQQGVYVRYCILFYC